MPSTQSTGVHVNAGAISAHRRYEFLSQTVEEVKKEMVREPGLDNERERIVREHHSPEGEKRKATPE